MSINSEEKQVYYPIPEVKTVISMLVDSIYNDQQYQLYLTNLEQSEEEVSNKKARIIKKTFTEIRVFNTKKDPLFLARDIGVLTGVSNINSIIKNYNKFEKRIGFIEHKGTLKQKYFLTKHGVYRTLLNSRTKLSEVFRGFIYELIDHTMTYEQDRVEKIMKDYADKNPEVIYESLVELHDNLNKYKELYELEMKEKQIWENKAETEHLRLISIENEKTEIEIENLYNEARIAQLKIDYEKAKNRIMLIRHDMICNNLAESEELEILKKKFLKEINIFIVKPEYAKKIVFKKKIIKKSIKKSKDKPSIESILELSDEESVIKKDINNIENFIDMEEEEEFFKTYELYFSKYIDIPNQSMEFIEDTMLYYYLTFKPLDSLNLEDKENIIHTKYIYCCTEYIYDRNKYKKLIDDIKNDCIFFTINASNKVINSCIFKTTLEHIKSVIHELILNP